MLVYDTGNVCVATATRCGHTSMYDHFKLPRYSINNGLDVWITSTSRRVLVLRNPYDRIQSALKNMSVVYDRIKTPNFISESWLKTHSEPYLISIPKDLDFEIIDFYNLSMYIKLSASTLVTNSNNVDISLYRDYPFIDEEYSRYQYFINNRKHISPNEWKELTQCGLH